MYNPTSISSTKHYIQKSSQNKSQSLRSSCIQSQDNILQNPIDQSLPNNPIYSNQFLSSRNTSLIQKQSDSNQQQGEQYEYQQQQESSLPLCLQEYYSNKLANQQQFCPNDSSEDLENKSLPAISQISQYIQNIKGKELSCKKTSFSQQSQNTQSKSQSKQQNIVISSQQPTITNNNTTAANHSLNNHSTAFNVLPSNNSLQFSSSLYFERNQELSLLLEQQRLKTFHFQKLLKLFIQQSKRQKQIFDQISATYHSRIERFNELQKQNRDLSLKISELQSENTHLKQLIYIANRNFQVLQQQSACQRHRLSAFQSERASRQSQFSSKILLIKEGMREMMGIGQGLGLGQRLGTGRPSDQREINIVDYQSVGRPGDRDSGEGSESVGDYCFSFGEGVDRRELLLLQSKQQKSKMAKLGKNLGLNGEKRNSEGIEKENLGSKRSLGHPFVNLNGSLKEIQLGNTSNFTTQKSLKSPKHANFGTIQSYPQTIEQNYRKIFMKTLSGSKDRII